MLRTALIIAFAFFCFYASAQDKNKVDSLKKVLASSPHDTVKIGIYNKLCQIHQFSDPAKGLIFCKQGEAIAKKLQHEKALAVINNTMGICNSSLSNYEAAQKNFTEALKIYEKLNYKPGISTSLNNLGIYYYNLGNYSKSLEYYIRSLKIDEELGDKIGLIYSYNNIGNIYKDLGNYDKALNYYILSLKLSKEENHLQGVAMANTGIGLVYWQQKKLSKAMEKFEEVLEIDKNLEDTASMGQDYNNLGIIQFELENYDASLNYFLKALKIHEKTDNKQLIAQINSNIGSIYEKKGEHDKAIDILNKSLKISEEIGLKEIMKTSYSSLSMSYAKKNDYKNAYVYHTKFSAVKDSLLNEESNKQIAEMQTLYESEKKEKAIALLTKEKEVQKLELNKKKLITYALGGGLLLLLGLSGVVFNSYNQKQKANRALALQNEAIKSQKLIIEEKNKDITDSIKYAKRIQEAILPPDNLVKRLLPDSFILYKPKDIVSGDFYWIESVIANEAKQSVSNNEIASGTRNDVTLIAAVDCTGHGVPGAFMSIVGHNGLTRVVNEKHLSSPAEILNSLNIMVNETLRQTYEESSVRDGMDIALCAIDFKNGILEFAGAYNPLLILRNGEVTEIAANKHPVGSFIGDELKPFTLNTIEIKKGDTFYIFTDGYADQFGGPKGKKYKYNKLKETLLQICEKPMSEQKKILNENFEAWKGSLEQIDDVCIIGVRV